MGLVLILPQRKLTDKSKTANIISLSFIEYLLQIFKKKINNNEHMFAKKHGIKSCCLEKQVFSAGML